MPKILKPLPTKDNLNLTAISIMANSNIPMKDNNRYMMFKKDMRYLIKDRLMTDMDAANEIWGREPFVEEVRGLAFAAERGHKYHRAHFNLSVELWHSVPNYSLNKLRLRIQDWLNENYGIAKNWNVFIRLHPGGRQVNVSQCIFIYLFS